MKLWNEDSPKEIAWSAGVAVFSIILASAVVFIMKHL